MEAKVQMITGSESATKNLAFCADIVDCIRKAFLSYGKDLGKLASCVQAYLGQKNWVVFVFVKAYVGWACSDNAFWFVVRVASAANPDDTYFVNCTHQEGKAVANVSLSAQLMAQPKDQTMAILHAGKQLSEDLVYMTFGGAYLKDSRNPKASTVLAYLERYSEVQGTKTKWCVVKTEDHVQVTGYSIPDFEFAVQLGKKIYIGLRVL